MWFLSTIYLNLIFLHVAFAAPLAINLSNRTIDFPVAADDDDQAITNPNATYEVRDIKMYKDLDVHLNIVGFGAFLESSLRRRVLDYTLSPLTKLGDNWASALQELEVKLIDSNDSNEVETLHLVCKTTLPQSNTQTYLEFKKEIHFFSDIVPEIEHFEEVENIPQMERIKAFPRYIGSRLSLNSRATIADSNAVLLLDNLKFSNFISKDRRSRLGRNETKASLKNITDELHFVFTNYSKNVLSTIEQQLQPGAAYLLKTDPDDHTPYTTICHRDLWTTNLMFKNGTGADGVIQVKLLDFQIYRYESFANDLIYFLLACADLNDLKTNFRSLIEYYHLEFTKTLKHVDLPLDDYTFDKMWVEVKQIAKLHLIRVLRHIKIRTAIYDDSILKRGTELVQYLIEQPASDIALTEWKCIIDLFIENEFI